MEQTTPLHVTNHYRRNSAEYESISDRLSHTRSTFLSAKRHKQIRMLQKSHSFAVISVQTPVAIHEDAFEKLWEGVDSRGLPPEWNIESALARVNYRHNKAEYIRHSLDHAHIWDDVCNLLEDYSRSGRNRGDADKAATASLDEAHKTILTEMRGVGPAKAPFVLAMLGFEEKMCIDANIVRAMGLDAHVSTVVVEKYDAICAKLRDKMPTLRDETSPFLWQWVTFDWQRGEISHHDTFFNIVLA